MGTRLTRCMMMLLICLTSLIVGCSASDPGPPSVRQTSTAEEPLADRIAFIETYVGFRRDYQRLEYDVTYHNNSTGRGVPAPSDWDIKIVAQVPPEMITQWIPTGLTVQPKPKADWVSSVAKEIDVSNIDQWYEQHGESVGVDFDNSIVAWRLHSF